MRKIGILLILGLVVSLAPSAQAAIKSGAKCTSKEYNRDTKIKVGSVTYACVGAESGYFWYPVTKPSTSNSNGFGTVLSLPAQNYVVTGRSLQVVQSDLGISFNTGTRPITLRELGDKIYLATSNLTGGYLTKNQVLIGLQPGNGLFNLLDGLMTNQYAFDAIAYEITLQGSKH